MADHVSDLTDAARTGSRDPRRTASISQGLEQLIADDDLHFEVLIVGSGYGGAIAAAKLAGCTQDGELIKICVLERGAEYLPGMFPSRAAELPSHVRFSTPSSAQAQGVRTGLFDLRLGSDVNALLANGLGGGSLINAGVMAAPADTVFDKPEWPAELREADERHDWYDKATRLLGARGTNGGDNVIELKSEQPLAKMQVLDELAKSGKCQAQFQSAPLSTFLTGQGPKLEGACTRCGDCATGCNYGAKNSLDTNLLDLAMRRGAKLVTGATVLRVIREQPKGWSLEVVHTDAKLRARQGAPFKVYAKKVILAAGTFGSTEILLRSTTAGLVFSPLLGQGFSSNGDMIAALYNHGRKANAVAHEGQAVERRGVGPTITGMLHAKSDKGTPILIEELAIPGSLRRIFEETITTAHLLHTLDRRDTDQHASGDRDPCAVDREAIGHTSIFALMGDDDAEGAIELIGGNAETDGDGAVRVRWPELSNKPLFDEQLDVLRELAEASDLGGTTIPNPLWRFVPESMEDLFDSKHGPLFTVHPLGGCRMGTDWRGGVVDHYGRVFKATSDVERAEQESRRTAVWTDLVVLDGSIVPTALGTNPALTIAALSLRAATGLRDSWGFDEPLREPPPPEARVPFRKIKLVKEVETEFELIERLRGSTELELSDGSREPCTIELTLQFKRFPLSQITGRDKKALKLDPDTSKLRIYRARQWDRSRRLASSGRELAELAPVTASLAGELTVLRREASTEKDRRKRALLAWVTNRGARDTWQWIFHPRKRPKTDPPKLKCDLGYGFWLRSLCKLCDRFSWLRMAWMKGVNAVALASHAGEVRLLEYELTIDKIERTDDEGNGGSKALEIRGLVKGATIQGKKYLTYGRRSNPWRQLQELKLTTFLGKDYKESKEPPVLELDTRYLGEEQVPLVRIAEQTDQPAALADLISFGAYILRIMISVHVWSFRRPDRAEPREPQRLPCVISGGWFRRRRTPEITELEVDQRDGVPVRVRLTHYKAPGLIPRLRPKPPVVMIHGYSASGTTFAHDAVRPNLAAYFLARHRDVWILDLRTSSGMPTARMPWRFEDAALVDIPAALAHIQRETGGELDVIAHCMGSAMLSMAVLSTPPPGVPFSREREKLPTWIRRAVLSQIGPSVEFSPENVLRGYVLSYIRHLLPIDRYEFRTGPDPSLTDQFIDRLLATLPYPEKEFDIENPPWWQCWRTTPWVGTRHRMDALYARDFDLENIPRRVLKHIDDLFGPLSIETVSQGIHFARRKVITNRAGRNVYVSPRQLNERWTFPTLSIHGENNGLANVATLSHMQRTFKEAGLNLLTTRRFPGFGHQDSLIGRGAGKVFKEIERFLDGDGSRKSAPQEDDEYWAKVAPRVKAGIPWIGPHVGPREKGDWIPIRAGTDPGPDRTGLVVFLAVDYDEELNRFVRTSGSEGTLFAAPVDPDGWIRLRLQIHESWERPVEKHERTGAGGIMMLTLNEESGRAGMALFDKKFARLRGALRGSQISMSLSSVTDEAQVAKIFERTLSPDPEERKQELVAINAYIKKLAWRVARELVRTLSRPSDELRPALIEVPPKTKEQKLCFAFGSCQYPRGLLDDKVADESMRLLAARLDQSKKPRPEFLLLLGDQIYVDATAGLFDPTSMDDRFVRPYELLYDRPSIQAVLRRIPAYMMLDDHEIDDNWEPGQEDIRNDPRLLDARRSYWRYQRFDNFQAAARDRTSELSFQFEHAGCPFYVLDTRTRRSRRLAQRLEDARIVPDEELAALKDWLSRQQADPKVADFPKFIASPAMPLPRHLFATDPKTAASALRSDGWDGYPHSLNELLAFIAENRIRNVVFLSGDAHLSCVATATLQGQDGPPVVVHSIHSSALYAPFPFANASTADFPDTDHTDQIECVTDGGRYVWNVKTTTFAPPGDGFTVLHRDPDPGAPLYCEFVRQGVAPTERLDMTVGEQHRKPPYSLELSPQAVPEMPSTRPIV